MTVSQRDVAGGAYKVQTLRVGDARVHRLSDIETVKWPAPSLLKWLTGDQLAAAAARLPPGMVDAESNSILLSFNSYVVETAGKVVLIDAGIGNGKERLDRPHWHRRDGLFMAALTEMGFAPERVDIVINTHMHADHVGWNTVADDNGDWVPAFPNARYLAPGVDLAFWSERFATEGDALLHGSFADSVVPLLKLGRLEGVALPHEIVSGLTLEPAPGHSPGMAVVRLHTDAAEVLFLADVIHHPAQLSDPSKGSNFCMDPAVAAATRRRLLDECAATATIVAPYHFPAPVFGRLRAVGEGFDYVPL